MVQKLKTWLSKKPFAKYPTISRGVAVLIIIGVVLLYPLGKAIMKRVKK